MLFAWGLKVTKCRIASIFFAMASSLFFDLQTPFPGVWGACVEHCGLQANKCANNRVGGRVLAGKIRQKGYTAMLSVVPSFWSGSKSGGRRFCIRIKGIAWALLLMERVVNPHRP